MFTLPFWIKDLLHTTKTPEYVLPFNLHWASNEVTSHQKASDPLNSLHPQTKRDSQLRQMVF